MLLRTLSIILIILIFLYLLKTQIIEKYSENNIRIYFINMNQNIDRWNKIKDTLPNLHRFEGINGKTLDPEKLIQQERLAEQNELLPGQLGCALSHMAVMEAIKIQDEPYGLILEDDVIVPPNFTEIFDNIKGYFPENWDIIFLGGCNIYGKKVNEKIIRPIDNSGTKNLCMHAVLLNKNSADKILKCLTPLYRPIDSQLREFFDDLVVFYLNPNIINQNKSLISNRRVLDGLPQSDYWKKHHMDITIEDFANQDNLKYL